MEYTEEIKKEADEVIKRIVYEISNHTILSEIRGIALKLAIQDRQSVLDKCKVHYQLVKENMKSTLQRAMVCSTITKEIQSLTQQIEYLKSKL